VTRRRAARAELSGAALQHPCASPPLASWDAKHDMSAHALQQKFASTFHTVHSERATAAEESPTFQLFNVIPERGMSTKDHRSLSNRVQPGTTEPRSPTTSCCTVKL